MIQRAFRHVISGVLLLILNDHLTAASAKVIPCHDHYSAASFEEANDDV